jgi:MOSC domain-containing protein YiiM
VSTPRESDDAPATATVDSVNVGSVRSIRLGRHTVETAIWKEPVSGRVPVRGVNLVGDDQADRSVHGGPDKAVYAYALEDTAWWEDEVGKELGAGAFGENLSVRGIDLTAARVGEIWRVGSTVLEVRQPRVPCYKLNIRMDDPTFVRRFARAGRPGAYLAVVEEGDVGAGDAIEVVERPDHDVTMGLFAHAILHDHARLQRLLAAPRLPEDWRRQIVELER